MYSKGSIFVYSYYVYSHESVGLMPSADPDSIGVQAQSHFLKSSREWTTLSKTMEAVNLAAHNRRIVLYNDLKSFWVLCPL